MDHQFLNVDCHPSALQRPSLHPSYPGPPGGAYSLDIRQPSDGNPPVDRFDPYRLPASSDSSGHASLSSSQFSAFDSFYKAYQSAYSQNSALAGVMFGHPSYRFDGPLLSHDQQLMLPTGFLQYPPLFPNSSLYAALPGSSANPRYQADYFGQNLSGLSSFSNSSKFNSGPDLGSQSWLGLERTMTSNLLNAFAAPSISSESSKDDRHCNDHLAKKVGEGDHYEPRAAFSNHSAHQPSSSSQMKFNRQTEETSVNSLRHHLLSSTNSLLSNDTHRDALQRRGNGEAIYPSRRQDYSFQNEKNEYAIQNSGKDSSFQKRGVLASPQSLSKSTSFPVMTTFPEVANTGDGPPNFARHNSDYLFNHYASKMYPPNSFSSESLSLQSKTALSSTIYQHQNALSQQKSNDKSKHEGTAKPTKAEDRSNSKNCTLFHGPKQVPPNNLPPDKTFEQKFHRPFELVPGKSTNENHRTSAANAPTHKVRRSSAKPLVTTEEKAERIGGSHKNAHHQSGQGSNQLQHFFKPESVVPTSCTERSSSTTESFVASSQSTFIRTKAGQEDKVARVEDETPLNLACGDGKTLDQKRSRSPPIRLLASKIDLEEAWRSALKAGKASNEDSSASRSCDSKFEDSYDDYEYECERKIARLTTIVSSVPIASPNNSQEKIDFLSSLGLSTVEKCKELEFEKRRRRKRQLRERSVSPTLLKDEESPAGGASSGCTSDCPHKNGLDKEAMLAMLGLHQVGVCDGKDKCYQDGGMCPMSSYGDTSTSYSHPFSYPPSTSFYSFPNQYPSLSTSVYSFYPPGYLLNQPSSAPCSSSSTSSTASSLNSRYCRFYDNPHVTSSKTTLSYPYQSSLANCFEGQQVYYHQGKDERIRAKADLSSSDPLDGSNCEGYDDVVDRNLLDSSEAGIAMMSRCTSSTPAGDRRTADESSPEENGLPKGSDRLSALFHWPGVDSVVEAYHRYIEERTTEKQLLLEHSAKLDKLNSQVLNTYEQLKNKISDLRKVREELEEERRSTQSHLEVLKDFIMQLK